VDCVCRHPWELVSAANWLKYPNEITNHVTHVDYLSRRVDPHTGILRTERLITCSQSIPKFLAMLVGEPTEAYVYELSEADPTNRTLRLTARNLSLANLMTAEECSTYTPSPANPSETVFKQEVRITSVGFSFLANKIEDFCVDRFNSNALKGKAALESALQRIKEETQDVVTRIREETSDVVNACEQFLKSRGS